MPTHRAQNQIVGHVGLARNIRAISCLAMLGVAFSVAVADDERHTQREHWRYHATKAEDAFAHGPYQPLPLAANKPDAILEEPAYRGHTRRYALLRYGSPNSPRVAVVVDELADGEFDLYVNADRDSFLTADDLVPGNGDLRETTLDAEITYTDRPPDTFSRQVVFRRSATGATLAVATAGYVEGDASLAGRPVKVRRIDGDANGLFADLRDRVWIDLGADRRWDPFTEQFPFTPILRLGERRYAVRSDAGGQRLALEEIVGAGAVTLRIASLPSAARVLELDATLYGDDGSAYAVRGVGQPATLPVGRYVFGSLRLVVEHPETKEPWRFVFSRSGTPASNAWRELKADEHIALDPIGKLQFVLEMRDDKQVLTPGETLTVNPRLYSEGGLLINSSSRGAQDQSFGDNSNTATVSLRTADAKVLSSYPSGFA